MAYSGVQKKLSCRQFGSCPAGQFQSASRSALEREFHLRFALGDFVYFHQAIFNAQLRFIDVLQNTFFFFVNGAKLVNKSSDLIFEFGRNCLAPNQRQF